MGLEDVTSLSSRAGFFPPHFLKIVLEERVIGTPHVLKLWLGVS